MNNTLQLGAAAAAAAAIGIKAEIGASSNPCSTSAGVIRSVISLPRGVHSGTGGKVHSDKNLPENLPDPILLPKDNNASLPQPPPALLERGPCGQIKTTVVAKQPIIKDGYYMPWVLMLGTKDRNRVIKTLGLGFVAGKRLVKASRRYKQNLSQRRSKVTTVASPKITM